MNDTTTKVVSTTESVAKETTRLLNKLTKAGFTVPVYTTDNPWSPDDVDRMESMDSKEYAEVVKACRFFYKRDPLIATTINKMVEIGINELVFHKNGLSDNELRIFTGISGKLQEFAESMAMEYLLSGLVIPEITYGTVTKETLKDYGIKKYESLVLPVTLWIRDPLTVKIKDTAFGDMPSYFAKVPKELVTFILNNGKYGDGTADPNLWNILTTYFAEFVSQVKAGQREFLLENDYIFRRKVGSDSPYPNCYVYPAIESLKHKRNLRRMDYSIASRAIGAIQLFKLGNDNFPVTEEDESQFDFIRAQMAYRNSSSFDIERIFQLFANHTLTVEWVYPDMSALLDERKYVQVDKDIIYSLGFPQILITGETEKSGSSNSQYATLSPIKTMENFRRKCLDVIKKCCMEISKQNNLKTEPDVSFRPLNLFDYTTLLTALENLYKDGNISRTTYDRELGFNFQDEADQLEADNKIVEEKKIGPFAPQPFSPQPLPGQKPQLVRKGQAPKSPNPTKPTTPAK